MTPDPPEQFKARYTRRNFCMELLYDIFGVSYTTVQTMKLLYETSLYSLPFPAKIMHKAFVNLVLTEDDEVVVPLCLIAIALAMQHLQGPPIIRSCWTKR